MKTLLVFLLFFLSFQCLAQKVRQKKPETVVKAIFDIAQKKNFESLRPLCDPQRANDKDTQMICDLADSDDDLKQKYTDAFSGGYITGSTLLTEDKGTKYAMVPFKFGAGKNNRSEELNLVKRGKNWYLLSF